jgi:hypothetical protein
VHRCRNANEAPRKWMPVCVCAATRGTEGLPAWGAPRASPPGRARCTPGTRQCRSPSARPAACRRQRGAPHCASHPSLAAAAVNRLHRAFFVVLAAQQAPHLFGELSHPGRPPPASHTPRRRRRKPHPARCRRTRVRGALHGPPHGQTPHGGAPLSEPPRRHEKSVASRGARWPPAPRPPPCRQGRQEPPPRQERGRREARADHQGGGPGCVGTERWAGRGTPNRPPRPACHAGVADCGAARARRV